MGRQEPLTSLALGRSPYDDVVEGEGEPDPHEPPRQYDERGRIVNPETKRIHRDIIRAHNEVMLVIGVAEPDNPTANDLASEAWRLHQEYENVAGRNFLHVGRVLGVVGIWGIHGIRQRAIVYREAATLSFMELMAMEWRTRSRSQLLTTGMPSFFGSWALQWAAKQSDVLENSVCIRAVIGYIRFHLQLHVVMQRLDLVPGSCWFPSWRFYVPFSAASPFALPPPLGSPAAPTLLQWVGKAALNIAPYAGYCLACYLWEVLGYSVRRQIRKRLPHPYGPLTKLVAAAMPRLPPVRSAPESPTLGEADREIRHSQQPEEEMALGVEGEMEQVAMGTIRRQGTFSSRGGDDYATDEEDADLVNPPLISFDVDTSESTEPPAGYWSAELRPNNSDDSRSQPKEAPSYRVNGLTCLPYLLAEDLATGTLTHLLLTPLDFLVFRGMARRFVSKFGVPAAAVGEGLPLRTLTNLVQVEALKLLVSVGVWMATTLISLEFRTTEKGWLEVCKERKRQEDEALAAERGSDRETGRMILELFQRERVLLDERERQRREREQEQDGGQGQAQEQDQEQEQGQGQDQDQDQDQDQNHEQEQEQAQAQEQAEPSPE
ncbi:hypothetical protein F5Y17DRAFT_420464 [Xylariaceae sp. FL0594]|nr:hypothetical protein F5Y17DRAFT_420464 [Xylariaceae sp. FL0594]